MIKRFVQPIRWLVMLLALGLLTLGLAACGSLDATQPLPGAGSTPTLYPAPTSTPRPEAVSDAEESQLPSSAAVSVSRIQTLAPEDGAQRRASPSVPATTTAPEDEGSDGAVASSQQLVAAFEDVLSSIYEEALSSVVYIRVASPFPESMRRFPGFPDNQLWNAGSGFVWDSNGHIVTNHHVVDSVIGRTNEVTVIFADSTQAKGVVVGGDPHSDLAVIKLEEGDWELQPVSLGDSSQVRVGQLAIAIGAPFGQEFTMTSGIVSAIGRNIRGGADFTIPEVIQTDSAINPGNSGGPLLDRLGQVIGINTQIVSDTGNYSGVGMAVPINIARRVVPSLIANGEFKYPWLGVSIATVDDTYAGRLGLADGVNGALVVQTYNGGPADNAGLRGSESVIRINGVDYAAGGDVIVAIGDHEVAGSSELIAFLAYNYSPGDEVVLTVIRDGTHEEIRVTLGQRPTGRQ